MARTKRTPRAPTVAEFFAADWYAEQNGDVVSSPKEALGHYLHQGWREGRNPHPLFDVSWYPTQNPTLTDLGEPLAHYLREGWRHGLNPHPAFDATWYLSQHRDVRDAGIEPLTHYLQSGSREGRWPHPLFDPLWYRAQAGLSLTAEEPLVHYLAQQWPTQHIAPCAFVDLEFIAQHEGLEHVTTPLDLLTSPPDTPNLLFDPNTYRERTRGEYDDWHSPSRDFARRAANGDVWLNTFFSTRTARTFNPRLSLMHEVGLAARQSYRALGRYADGSVVVGDETLGPGPAPDQPVAIFVHFDATLQVQPYVIAYLKNLADAGVCILFVSGNAALTPAAISALRPLVWRVLTTNNEAYDWGLYAIGVKALGDLAPGRALLLANDSCSGSLTPLAPFVQAAQQNRFDLYGATDSRELEPHLQSYFIWVGSRVTASTHWQNFWRLYAPVADKNYVIVAYEMGFTRFFRDAGFTIGAHWAYDDIVAKAKVDDSAPWRQQLIAHNREVNPTHICWDLLIAQGYPFVKRQLVASNPAGVPNLHLLLNLL